MRKYLAGVFLIQTALSSNIGLSKVKTNIKNNKIERVIDASFSKTNSITLNNKKFIEFDLAGETSGYGAILYKVGAPRIPVIRFYAYGKVDVDFNSEEKQILSLSAQISPNQESALKSKKATKTFSMDNEIYNSDALYPAGPRVKVEEAGSIRGQKRFLVTLIPMKVRPKSGQISYVSKFKVTSELPKEENNKGKTIAFVTAQRFENSPALKAYSNLKAEQGFNVENIVVGSEVSTAEAIRSRLQISLQERNLKFALLIGDIEDVPSYDQASIYGPSDHYFRAIDTNDYASDINGPDIGVGRISARTEKELSDILEKYTQYRSMQNLKQWQKQAAFLATDDRYEIAEGSHNYAIDNYTSPAGFEGIFPENLTPGGDKLYAITYRAPNNIVQQALQAGRAIINYSGHGATTFWDAPRVTQSDVRAIQDTQAMPFVVSNACITGDFRVEESFAETWQRHPFGAVMFWGSMDNTYWDEDDILERSMYDGIFQEGKSSFSEITQHALSEHWRHYGGAGKSAYYWETYTLFGDPSLELASSAK
ncbi:hypothetical protein GW915_04400 [bacterium]|nr:hypothetical protein [bacterium]